MSYKLLLLLGFVAILTCGFLAGGCASGQTGPSGHVELTDSEVNELIDIARRNVKGTGVLQKNQYKQYQFIMTQPPQITSYYSKIVMVWNLPDTNKNFKAVFQGQLMTDQMIVRFSSTRTTPQVNYGDVPIERVKSDMNLRDILRIKEQF